MRLAWLVLMLGALASGGCFRGSSADTVNNGGATGGRVSDAAREYALDTLPTANITIGEHVFRVWLARDDDAQRPGLVQEGLMHVPTSELADDQGMLFVFPEERVRGFWMKNTIAPLDIAFARANGTIVKIWQMPPLSLATYSSIEPAMFALEVKQGTFGPLGIKEGDRLVVPAAVLDFAP
jgi:uncharacterized protein